ncbi:MAG: START domain-containing protein [Moraxellaceae bacterium]|nr:START domain-containing protein [Moraxellaceae bacterium]
MLIKLLLVLSLVLLPGMTPAEDWAEARNANDIRVWTRAVPGYPLREFRATTVVRSSLAGLVNLLLDTGHAADWVYRTRRIDVLQRDDEKATFVIHIVTDFPWPLSDRDVIVAGRIFQEADGTVRIISQSLLDDQHPKAPGCLRMVDFYGNWTFRPLGDGLVEVSMLGRANPGGVIPHGIVNLIIHDTPYQTLRGLQRVISQPRYQSARFNAIQEPAQ